MFVDGLPKWTGVNEGENSELIEDSSQEDIKAWERKRVKIAAEKNEKGENKSANE